MKKEQKPKKEKVDYKKHWEGMPEFVQDSIEPMKKLIVCFESNEDMLAFSKLVGQVITAKTRSIHYPAQDINKIFDKRWSDKKTKTKK